MKTKRLRLGKETLRSLQPDQLQRVAGATDLKQCTQPGPPFTIFIEAPTKNLDRCTRAPTGGTGCDSLRSYDCPTLGFECHARFNR